MKKNGFTLIELLIVISIIGIISGVVLTSINIARSKARDNVRKQSLKELRTALEIYFSNNGTYPSTSDLWYGSSAVDGPGINNNGGDWIPGLVASGGIGQLPNDPSVGIGILSAPCGGVYYRSFLYRSTNGSGYKLLSHCAPEGNISSVDPFYDSVRPSWAFQVCSGNECSL